MKKEDSCGEVHYKRQHGLSKLSDGEDRVYWRLRNVLPQQQWSWVWRYWTTDRELRLGSCWNGKGWFAWCRESVCRIGDVQCIQPVLFCLFCFVFLVDSFCSFHFANPFSYLDLPYVMWSCWIDGVAQEKMHNAGAGSNNTTINKSHRLQSFRRPKQWRSTIGGSQTQVSFPSFRSECSCILSRQKEKLYAPKNLTMKLYTCNPHPSEKRVQANAELTQSSVYMSDRPAGCCPRGWNSDVAEKPT